MGDSKEDKDDYYLAVYVDIDTFSNDISNRKYRN